MPLKETEANCGTSLAKTLHIEPGTKIFIKNTGDCPLEARFEGTRPDENDPKKFLETAIIDKGSYLMFAPVWHSGDKLWEKQPDVCKIKCLGKHLPEHKCKFQTLVSNETQVNNEHNPETHVKISSPQHAMTPLQQKSQDCVTNRQQTDQYRGDRGKPSNTTEKLDKGTSLEMWVKNFGDCLLVVDYWVRINEDTTEAKNFQLQKNASLAFSVNDCARYRIFCTKKENNDPCDCKYKLMISHS